MRSNATQTKPEHAAPPWASPQQNLIRPRYETEVRQQMTCDVVFGSPTANCMGTGVCRISARTGGSPSAATQQRSCQSTVGLLFPIDGGRGISMVLTRAFLCTQLYKTHLRHGALRLENACSLPANLIETLGLHFDALMPGEYPVLESGEFLRVDFR